MKSTFKPNNENIYLSSLLRSCGTKRMENAEVIVYRGICLGEAYAANIAAKHDENIQLVESKPGKKLSQEDLGLCKNKHVIMLGAHSPSDIDEIARDAATFTMYYLNTDPIPNYEHVHAIPQVVGFPTAFAEFYIKNISDFDRKILKHMDAFPYGYSGEEAHFLHLGIQEIDKSSPIERVATLKTQEDYDQAIERGKTANKRNHTLALQRINSMCNYILAMKDNTLVEVCCVSGDHPIIETCQLLASKSPSGVGIVFRQDYAESMTHLYVGSTENSGIHAADIAIFLGSDGKGSPEIGTAIKAGLLTPEDFGLVRKP